MTQLEAKIEREKLEKRIKELAEIVDPPPTIVEPKTHVWAMRDLVDPSIVWFHFRVTNWEEVTASRSRFNEKVGYYPSGIPEFGCQGYRVKDDGMFAWNGGWIVTKTWKFTEELLDVPVPAELLSSQFQP